MATAHTYLNFNGNTEEAFNFYKTVFGVEFLNLVRFSDMGDMGPENRIPEADEHKIMHVGIDMGNGSLLMGTDALESLGQKLDMGNNSYVYLEADTPEEAQRLFGELSAGGKMEMELNSTPWAELFSSFSDKFGVQWMVSYTGEVRFG